MLAQDQEPALDDLLAEMETERPSLGGRCRICAEVSPVGLAFISKAALQGHSYERIATKLRTAFAISVGQSTVRNHLRQHGARSNG